MCESWRLGVWTESWAEAQVGPWAEARTEAQVGPWTEARTDIGAEIGRLAGGGARVFPLPPYSGLTAPL